MDQIIMVKKTDKRIILLVALNKPHNAIVGRQLRQWLNQHAAVVADNLDSPLNIADLPKADYIVVLGGDGTILSTVRDMGEKQIPVIGVNVGKLGFLAEFSLDELKGQFDRIISQDSEKPSYTQRIMLKCHVEGPNRDEFTSPAVNEIAVIAGPPFRMIEISVGIADENLALCSGDGLIVATPTGSTAYNLSAGGPILAPTIQSVVITPLAAHSLNFRPIVIDPDKTITLRCQSYHAQLADKAKGSGELKGGAVVVIDGQVSTPLTREDKVIITKDNAGFMLVANNCCSQWQLLNRKLHWGAMPNYNRT